MARLAPSLEETRDSAILKLVSLEKQAREGRVRGFFQIPKFPEDPELCQVWALTAYFNMLTSVNFLSFILNYLLMSLQVSGICQNQESFFVTLVKRHKSVTSQTLARWMKSTLTSAGIDSNV